MEVKGIIKLINETQTFGEKGFRKREVVVTTQDSQYPQHILIEFVQDKTELLDHYKEGQEVTISINLRGREYTNPQGEVKYFNSLNGWKIEAEPIQEQKPSSYAPPTDAFEPIEDDSNEPPF
jgi:translation initiation factor IF-3